ncbi:MAG: transglutaminase-like domain-containing protein [Arcobacter sp.]|uniref:transglutaminase-like domain-containing protein n=1 Tax=Arcobacter sp. TaxID=1872629 RepID=UPI003AFF870C
MEKFLEETNIIDYSNQEIQKLAKGLSSGCKIDIEIVKKCFEFVRDEIRHSGDSKDNIVTLKASDVLKYKTGWCYVKSHLLAALLRANNIPCGLAYQRLTISDDGSGDKFCIHGLNSVYLKDFGCYRIDARGNKDGVNAKFDPPHEKLAFPIRFKGEKDLPKVYAKPLDIVIDSFKKHNNYIDMSNNLPDIKIDVIDNKIEQE